jgi:hypothetical protein
VIVAILASGLFLFIFTVVAVRKFGFIGLKFALMIFALAGIYFVWNPEKMTELAHLFGVGRGADLVAYATTTLVFLTVVAGVIRERRANDTLTVLVRRLAIRHARAPKA